MNAKAEVITGLCLAYAALSLILSFAFLWHEYDCDRKALEGKRPIVVVIKNIFLPLVVLFCTPLYLFRFFKWLFTPVKPETLGQMLQRVHRQKP